MSFLTTKQGEGIKFKEIDNKTRGGVGGDKIQGNRRPSTDRKI